MMLSELSVVDTLACIPCIAEVAGVSSFETRSWTLCPFHYSEWADEKMAAEDFEYYFED